MKWSIGITSAARDINFLPATIDTLQQAGWSGKDIRVFADHNCPPVEHDVEVVRRPTQLGAWKNWRQGLRDLLSGKPLADVYALVQDDIEVRSDTRGKIETMIQQSPVSAVYTPYVSRKDATYLELRTAGWQQLRAGSTLCGACFFAMASPFARHLNKTLPLEVHENKHIDAYLGTYLLDNEFPLFVHRPSLLQHLADAHSTLGYKESPFCRTAHGYRGG